MRLEILARRAEQLDSHTAHSRRKLRQTDNRVAQFGQHAQPAAIARPARSMQERHAMRSRLRELRGARNRYLDARQRSVLSIGNAGHEAQVITYGMPDGLLLAELT